MRASSGTIRTILGAGLLLFTAAVPACDAGSVSSTENSAAVAQAVPVTAFSGAALATASVKSGGPTHTYPTRHEWRIEKSTRGAADSGARSLRAAYIESVERDADASHAARRDGEGSLRFDNKTQHLRADLNENGLSVQGLDGEALTGSVGFKLSQYGCVGEAGERQTQVRPAIASDGANRVRYNRSRLVEWYRNGRLGLEQGFDLREAPTCKSGHADKPLQLTMELRHGADLQPILMHGQDGTQWLELRDARNQVALRYSDLYASDADGKALPATMSLDGETLGLRIDDRGARYPLRVDPLIWAQYGSLYKAADPDATDLFGSSVAISGDHAVIGAPRDDQGATDAGAAYVFTLSSQGNWIQQAKILAVTPTAGGLIGSSVAISDVGGGNKRLVVGAPGDTAVPGVAAWFVGHGATWSPEAEFSSVNSFGASVAVSGDYVVVGAPADISMDGSAVIYEPDLALSPPWREKTIISGMTGSLEQLGTSVAISRSVVAVGAPNSDLGAMDAGRIEIWERDPASSTWLKTGALQATDRAANDRLGASVAASLRTVVAGAPGKSSAAGAAYVFTNVLGTWDQEAKLTSAAGIASEAFGTSVAVSTDRTVVGVPLRAVSGQSEAGALEVFTRSGTTWTFESQVTARTPLGTDRFGSSLAYADATGHILTGAPRNDTTNTDSGGYYDVIQLKQTGDGCTANVECASSFCVDAVCCESACGGNTDADCQACATGKTGLANGLCRAASSTSICRPAADLCDSQETCDGTNLACPTDVLKNSGVVCRNAVGACDAPEMCNGTSAACPNDTVSATNTICRAAAGDCDVAERCDGQTKACPADLMKPSYSLCRLPSNECDAFELCDGQSVTCPTDVKNADGTLCAAGSCQAGMCRVEADLAISISGWPVGAAQQALPIAVSVSNAGRSPASAVNVDITLPQGSSVESAGGGGWSCRIQDTTVQCTRGTLAFGELAQISLLVNPPGNSERITVMARVNASVMDPNMTNNSATFDESTVSTRVSGTGLGCAAAPTGSGPSGALSTLFGMLSLLALTAMRRRRAS